MSKGRGGIWGKADEFVDAILDLCIENVGNDIGNKTLQYETAIGAGEPPPLKDKPTEDYYRGFDDGLKAAIASLEMIKDGDL